MPTLRNETVNARADVRRQESVPWWPSAAVFVPDETTRDGTAAAPSPVEFFVVEARIWKRCMACQRNVAKADDRTPKANHEHGQRGWLRRHKVGDDHQARSAAATICGRQRQQHHRSFEAAGNAGIRAGQCMGGMRAALVAATCNAVLCGGWQRVWRTPGGRWAIG